MSTAETQIGVNTNLQKQDLSNLDISNLTPLSPEVISRQATINIGTIGHVAHGKSTVVKAISGVQTVRFKNELERNITIKLVRISEGVMKSRKQLREFEKREEARVERLMRERRRQRQNRSQSTDTLLTNSNSLCRTSYYQNSISPSSGYESLTDNASNYSGEYNLTPKRSLSNKNNETSISLVLQNFVKTQQKHDKQQQHKIKFYKRRFSQTSSTDKGQKTPNSPINKRRKLNNFNTKEYIVERIESLESINGNPLFFVKWKDYSSNENTWESFENLIECASLESFIEKQFVLFEVTITAIVHEIEIEITDNSLSYDSSKINMQELDEYEPLALKTDLILLAQFREARSKNKREPQKIKERCLKMLLMKPLHYLRKQQLVKLKDWKENVNCVEYEAPINIENNVDFDTPDADFKYIKENISGKGVLIMKDPPIGCKCDDMCAPSSKCCARLADNFFAYDKSGRLRLQTGEAIYECNNRCLCDINCNNRIIQRGRKNSLCVFKTSTNCGWGVRTEYPIRKGEYVCQYIGEIITADESNERGKQYDTIGRTYLFDLDYNTTNEIVYTIDAAKYGNVSHFINHSCDPNLAVFPFWINNLDINMPGLAFFSIRPIKAGEELSFDYIRTDLSGNNDYENLSKAEKVTCRCGATNCRKVLF